MRMKILLCNVLSQYLIDSAKVGMQSSVAGFKTEAIARAAMLLFLLGKEYFTVEQVNEALKAQ